MPQDKTGDPRQSAGNKLSVLRKHPIFADLAPEALDQLCRYAKHTTVKRGATIAAKGDPGNNLFAVITGTVKISSSSPDGRNAILNLIGPGEIFGTRQAGLPEFRIANLVRDKAILELAKREAEHFVNHPEIFSEGERARVRSRLKEAWQRRYGLVEAG